MPDAAHPHEAVALDWVIRMRDPSFTDWDGLSAWLEADPAHAEAFDRLSLADEAIAGELAAPPQAPATPVEAPGLGALTAGERRRDRGRRAVRTPPIWKAAAAVAACLAVSFGLLRSGGLLRGETVLRAPADAMRVVSWGDRGQVDLAAGSRLVLDDRTAGVARLDRGQATFRIRHDPARPVIVEVGEARVVDIGTVFDLRRTAGGVDLAVSEGRVRYEGSGQRLEVAAGQRLSVSGDQVSLKAAGPGTDAGSAPARPARLTYDRASLARVAADLSRAGVLKVRADPAVAGRTFTGTIALDGDGPAVRRRLALLLGVTLRADGQGWVMTAARDRAQAS